MKLHKTIILVLTLLNFGSIDAQKQKDWIELGDQAYAIGDYYGARHYFENALNMDSAKAALQYKYAETLRNINDYKGAEHQYDKVYRKDRGRFYPMGIFWIAKMNEYIGDYEKAIEFWKKYKSGNDSDMKKRIQQRLKSCEFAENNKDSIAQYEGTQWDVTNAGRKINSAESEFGLFMIGDSILYYSSLRGDYSDEDVLLENKYNIKLYKSKLKRKFNRFTVGKELGEHINTEEMITANGSFNNDLSLFFYSQCDQERNCVIMVADHAKGKFTNPRKVGLKVNTPNASTTQPNIAKIGEQEYLFFSSNRPGGFGKNDIWFCKIKEENVLNEVQNMGGTINTQDNEISPFYDEEKMGLYFSSDWHEGFGGFDIFYSGGLPLTYTVTPRNLLAPFNSSANDMYFGKTSTHEGYLTSNRVGSLGQKGETCCNDIWFFGESEEIDSLLVNEKETSTENGETSSFDENYIDPKDRVLPEIENIEDLSKYLPITLYFDNDHPNPKTLQTETDKTYNQTYKRYHTLRQEYKDNIPSEFDGKKRAQDENAIDLFFDNKLRKGNDDLLFFCRLLERELLKGRKIELAIKGYASPLSSSDYNKNLTLRRIRSLINELNEWDNKALKPFILRNEEDLGQLLFKEIPFGESKAGKNVSDNLEDRAVSVYSVEAASERRIEILEVEEMK